MGKNTREIRIPAEGDYLDPEKITAINDRLMAEAYGEDKAVHRFEIETIEDDHDRKVRVLKIQSKRTYIY